MNPAFTATFDNKRHTALLLCAIFLLGCATLGYQILFERLIKLTVGGTVVSSFIVTYTTLVGMGIGAILSIRPAIKKLFPLSVISWICGIYAIWSSITILPFMEFMAGIGITKHLHPTVSHMLLYASALIVLLPIALLSGAIIPRIMRYTDTYLFRSSGFLYATFTAGSACIVYILIRVLLPMYDLQQGLLVVSGTFFLPGFFVYYIDRAMHERDEPPIVRVPPAIPKKYTAMMIVSSFMTIIIELSIFRAIAVTWGGESPYAYPFAIATYLLAYAAGSLIVTPLYKKYSERIGLAPLLLTIPLLFVVTMYLPKTIPNQGLLSLFFVGGLEFTMLVAFVSGSIFPLLLALYPKNQIEWQSARLSLASALGSGMGGLFAVLLGFPLLGTRMTIIVASVVYLIFVIFLLTRRPARSRYIRMATIIVILLVLVPETVWGRWILKSPSPYTEYKEGPGGIAAIHWTDAEHTGGSVFINGTVASYIPFQPGHATLAAIASGAPDKERVLILGLGGAGIVRDVLEFARVRSVDVVEWSHELISLVQTSDIKGLLHESLQDSRVTVIPADAHTYAVTALAQQKTYPLIIDNLTVIGWSGSTSVRSVEYFRSLMPLLTPDGIYLLYAHYNTDAQYAAAVSGLLSVCPYLFSYDTKYVICAKQDIVWDTPAMDNTLRTYSQLPQLFQALTYEPHWIDKKYKRIHPADYAGVEPIHDTRPFFEYEEFALKK